MGKEIEEIEEAKGSGKNPDKNDEIWIGSSGFTLGLGGAVGVYPTPLFVRVANAGLISLRVKRVRQE